MGGLDVKADKTLFCLFFPEVAVAAAQQQQTELELEQMTAPSALASPIHAAPPKKTFKPIVESEYADEVRGENIMYHRLMLIFIRMRMHIVTCTWHVMLMLMSYSGTY